MVLEVPMMNGNGDDREEICNICGISLTPGHKESLKHRFNFVVFEWNRYRKKIVKNRHGVEVTVSLVDVVNGNKLRYTSEEKKGSHITKATVEQATLQNNGIKYLFTITNAQSNNIYLINAILLHPYEYFQLEDFEGKLNGTNILELEPGAVYSFKVVFHPDTVVIGSFIIPVAIQFQTVKDEAFTISREMVVIISDEEEIAPVSNGKSPFTSVVWHDIQEWVRATTSDPPNDDYAIPKRYRKVLRTGLSEYGEMPYDELALLQEVKSKLSPNFPTPENYRDFFHFSLWLDEMGAELMLQRYNMENVTMTTVSRFLELAVPGLAEKRPSLIAGDMVNIRVHEDHTAYKGVIRKVNDATIWIEGVAPVLAEYIEDCPDIELDVAFQLGRLPYERMHAGVDQCYTNKMMQCLFPDPNLVNRNITTRYHVPDNEFFNRDIVTNAEQKNAVESILNCKSGKAPYIVFGPPGTGKTVTIVEAILQIKKRVKNARILVCAPANAACDMLTLKLQPHCGNSELIRVHSNSRDWGSVPDDVKPYSNYADGQYTKPTGTDLMDYRIVITTLVLSGRYSSNQKFFPDFVFIDEAAQAMEPEADIAIALLTLGKQLVLAGDPKQLGPQCSSTVAEKYKLGVSLLDRLMDTSVYKSENPNFITMLKQNFRAHPVVLQLPNELFYDKQLQAKSKFALKDPIADVFIYHKIAPPKQSKKKNKAPVLAAGQPVEFCAIFAKERREGRSPSYFNQSEIEMVLKYVKALTSLIETKVEPVDIGIVTPYVRQVYRIKERLKHVGFGDVEVGTTEVFQGREKRIIIISTVRAQHSLLLHDRRYKLGFIKNEKRFNVALTRAMSKLIIIGCPNVLRYDENWLKYIDFCEDRNAYFGAKFDRRTDAVKTEVIHRVSHVHSRDAQYRS